MNCSCSKEFLIDGKVNFEVPSMSIKLFIGAPNLLEGLSKWGMLGPKIIFFEYFSESVRYIVLKLYVMRGI